MDPATQAGSLLKMSNKTGSLSGPFVLLAAFFGGLAASVGLGLITSVIAYWGPQGHSYFLGGNSALAFSYELAPAFVSAGWTTLALHLRRSSNAVLLGFAAGVIGAGMLAAYWAIAIQFGLESGLAVLTLAWDVAAPILALTLPQRLFGGTRGRSLGNPWWHASAAAVLLLVVVVLTTRLELCGPSLGGPMSAREFAVCLPVGP